MIVHPTCRAREGAKRCIAASGGYQYYTSSNCWLLSIIPHRSGLTIFTKRLLIPLAVERTLAKGYIEDDDFLRVVAIISMCI